MNPFSRYDVFQIRLTAANVREIFGQADIVVEALDAAESKLELAESWIEAFPDRPFILGSGIGGNNAVSTRNIYGQLYACGDGVSDADHYPPLAPKVALVATMQANLALELLLTRQV